MRKPAQIGENLNSQDAKSAKELQDVCHDIRFRFLSLTWRSWRFGGEKIFIFT
jgi:hypothetical protein